MKTYIALLAIIILAGCTRTCEKRGKHNKVTYVNNSDRKIKYFVVDNYPDTAMPRSLTTGAFGK